MVWTGIATDLTLDDVIGPPRDSAPTSPLATVLREAVSAGRDPARAAPPAAQPQAYQPRPLSDGGAPARPRPHVSVTEDMLPPRKNKRRYWLLGALVLTIVVLVVGLLSRRDTPPDAAPAPAVEAEAPAPAPTADDAPEVPAEWTGAPPKKALRTPAAKKAKPVSHDVDHVEPHAAPDAAEPAGEAGDLSLEKFRQLSGKI